MATGTDKGTDTDSQKPYTIQRVSERHARRFGVEEVTFKATFKNSHQDIKLLDTTENLQAMFDDIMANVNTNHPDPNDRARVSIRHAGLERDIVIHCQPQHNITGEVIMDRVAAVLQSHQHLNIDSSFHVDVGIMRRTEAGGGRHGGSLPITNTDISFSQNSIIKKKSMVFIPAVEGEWLCAARAIVTCMAKVTGMDAKDYRMLIARNNLHSKNPKSQKMRALALHTKAGVSPNRAVSLADLVRFERVLKVQIIVISGDVGNEVIYKGSQVMPRKIFLYLKDHHFHAIVNIKGFYVKRRLCVHCLTTYSTSVNSYHSCAFACLTCARSNCVYDEESIQCTDCNMTCRNSECFSIHKLTREYPPGPRHGEERPSLCDTNYKCVKCFKVMNRLKRDIKTHACGEWFCRCCNNYVINDHLCYYRLKKPRHTSGRFIFYDFETSQDTMISCDKGFQCKPVADCPNCQNGQYCSSCRNCINCKKGYCGLQRHVPNFVIAQTACNLCKEAPCTPDSYCTECGQRCHRCEQRKSGGFARPPCQNGICGLRETVFKGSGAHVAFCQWLISPQHDDTVVIAHNAKSFDSHFILAYCVENGLFPDIVYSGTKIMTMSLKGGVTMRFIDSLNFLPMALKKLPKALNLKGNLAKGAFPHFANIAQNWHYKGKYFPPEMYGVDHMSTDERSEFMQWYNTVKNQTFDFQAEILAYTRADVIILREACLTFRDLIMTITTLNETGLAGIDPFAHSTIASSAMQIIRQLLIYEVHDITLIDGRQGQGVLKKGSWFFEGQQIDSAMISETKFVKSPIPQIPARGYCKHVKSSHKASIWLQWVAYVNNRKIQSAQNGGEYRIPGSLYHVDGYHASTKTVYEFLGCYFHGHHCIENREKLRDGRTQTTFKRLFERTKARLEEIRGKGYTVVEMWECHFDGLLQCNSELQSFAEKCEKFERLVIRDAFTGGRVEPFRLFYNVEADEKMRYLDFTSLYPFVNLVGRYPISHPQIITDPKTMDHTLNNYYGIAKVQILPPKGLYIPVLPYRCNGKLKFPLCAKCAESEPVTPCTCTEAERVLLGTWTTMELQEAVTQGYQIIKIFEIYHFPETTTDASCHGSVFEDYVKMFMKVKQEASGYPSWVKTEADKDTYIRYYEENQGICLDKSKIAYNAPLRLISKLYANSAWGKFVQRTNLTRTMYVKSEADLVKLRNDPTQDIMDFHMITENFLAIEYRQESAHIDDPMFQNEVIGVFTTSLARLHLLKVLQITNTQTVYCDTDSVIYIEKNGNTMLPVGDLLGQLTDELPQNCFIKTFLSSGPKSYCLVLNNEDCIMKIKGLSLNHANRQIIDLQAMKDIIFGVKERITLPYTTIISRVKHRGIVYNRPHSKTFRLVFTKRQPLDNTYDTKPYGF